MTPAQYAQLLECYSGAALKAMAKRRRLAESKKSTIVPALAAVLEDERSVASIAPLLIPEQRLLLAVLRELGGECTVQQLKAAAARVGMARADQDLRELIQNALVLYASPGRSMHELWTAERRHYGWQPDPHYRIRAVPPALALGDTTVRLPPLAIAPYQGEPAAVEEQSPAAL